MTSPSILLATLVFIVLLAGCGTQPTRDGLGRDAIYEGAVNAAEHFRREEMLEPFFRDAIAYAMFPRVYRAGAGYGLAYGSGWVIRADGEPLGKTRVWQFNAGPHMGAQYYEQILFFRTEESLQRFMSGTLEFGGQVNATIATAGLAVTPSYNEDIALFTNIGGGLMLEGSIGGHQYTFSPLSK